MQNGLRILILERRMLSQIFKMDAKERARIWYQNNKEKVKLYYQSNKEERRRKAKDYRLKNKEMIIEKQRECYLKNKEKIKEKCKNYYLRNKEKIKTNQKEYRLRNKEKIQERKIENYQKNRDKILEKRRKYYLKNKERIREHLRKRRKDDLWFRMSTDMRNKIVRRIKNNNGRKNCSTVRLLGCSVNEARCYLESLFKSGMNWRNYGVYGWHIDHIIPCKDFDLTDEKEQKLCFHYTNLQPLWVDEHRLKSASEMQKN